MSSNEILGEDDNLRRAADSLRRTILSSNNVSTAVEKLDAISIYVHALEDSKTFDWGRPGVLCLLAYLDTSMMSKIHMEIVSDGHSMTTHGEKLRKVEEMLASQREKLCISCA